MADGNVSQIIIWNTDTIIMKKQLDNQTLYYTADAATGTPEGRSRRPCLAGRRQAK